MAKINEPENKFRWAYILGISTILALPILTLPPYFFPPDWGKVLVFRSIMAVLLFLFAYQYLYKRDELKLPEVKKNKIICLLAGLFLIYLLASIFSVDSYFSFWGSTLRSGGFVNFAFYIIFSVFIFLIAKEKDWKNFWTVSIFAGILVSLLAIVQYYGWFNKIFLATPDRPPSSIGNPIFLGIYLLLLFFITGGFLIKEKQFGYKIFYGVALFLSAVTILITVSRAAYLGLIIGFIYFLIFYPKKFKIAKITAVIFLVLVGTIVIYANTVSQFPQFLESNRLFKSVEPRLSIKSFLGDSRFPTWMVGIRALEDRPLLGYGPENFSVGFDKYYDYSIGNEWWDRAHNVLVETGSDAGIFAVIIYLSIFGVLFWQLQKTKNNPDASETTKTICHAVQTTFVSYLVANFFSIDDTPTYLLFFFIVGYSLFLTNKNQNLETQKLNYKNIKVKNWITGFLFFCVFIFLWQYNFVPFFINAETNKASSLVDSKQCNQGLAVMENLMNQHSFLDNSIRLNYVNLMRTCAGYQPERNLEFAQKGLEVLLQASEIRPLYPRTWLYLGSFETVILASETDQNKKPEELKLAYGYFDKADQMAPNHQDILLERIKTDMVASSYKTMSEDASKCIKFNPMAGECYFQKALSEIFQQNFGQVNQYLELTKGKGLDASSGPNLIRLASAYSDAGSYQTAVKIYEQLVAGDPGVPEYHSSLAYIYSKMGNYQKARAQAEIFLQLMPSAKDEVNAFLKTLP